MVSTSGTSDNNGIVVGAVANNNVLNNNTIQTQGTSNTNYGIYLTSTVSGNNLTGNVITTNGTNNNHGIRFETSSNNNTVHTNFITTLSNLSYGISLLDSSDNRFNGTILNATTEWIHSGIEMLNNFSNTTFQTGNGSINSTPLWTLTGLQNITQVRLNITNNATFVNATNLTMLNTSARLILNNIQFTNPEPYFDVNDVSSFEKCSGSVCSEVSFTGGAYVFDVTHFTTYASLEGATGSGGGLASSSASSATGPGVQHAAQIATMTTQTATFALQKADAVVFNVRNEKHTLSVLSLTPRTVTSRVESTPQEFTLKKGETINIDVNDDHTNDLHIKLNEIDITVAHFTITKLAQPIAILLQPQLEHAKTTLPNTKTILESPELIQTIHESIKQPSKTQHYLNTTKIATAVLLIALASVFTILILRKPPLHPPKHHTLFQAPKPGLPTLYTLPPTPLKRAKK